MLFFNGAAHSGRARDALRGGEALAEIAANLGFADQSHLGRAFGKVMGATPGQYRQSFVRREASAQGV